MSIHQTGDIDSSPRDFDAEPIAIADPVSPGRLGENEQASRPEPTPGQGPSRQNSAMLLTLIYDGGCPFCREFALRSELKAGVHRPSDC